MNFLKASISFLRSINQYKALRRESYDDLLCRVSIILHSGKYCSENATKTATYCAETFCSHFKDLLHNILFVIIVNATHLKSILSRRFLGVRVPLS